MAASAITDAIKAEKVRIIDVASMAGVSPHTVYRYLRGERIHPVLRQKLDDINRELEAKAAAVAQANAAS